MCKCLSQFYRSTLHNKSESLFYNSREEKSCFYLIHFTSWKCYQVTAFYQLIPLWHRSDRKALTESKEHEDGCGSAAASRWFQHPPLNVQTSLISFFSSHSLSSSALVLSIFPTAFLAVPFLRLRFIVLRCFAWFRPLIINLVYFCNHYYYFSLPTILKIPSAVFLSWQPSHSTQRYENMFFFTTFF